MKILIYNVLNNLKFSTKVECAGLCLSTSNCYAFYWEISQCKMMGPPATPVGTFKITTDNGKMTMCQDHQNWSPYTVYADNSNLPPMCPSKSCHDKTDYCFRLIITFHEFFRIFHFI